MAAVMSFADITVPPMSVTVIRYSGRMGRWQPDARGRLEKAAMELYVERGFDETTVAEIAERAGLTERTFFRHFADKREILFAGAALLQEVLVQAVVDAPADAGPGRRRPRRHRGRRGADPAAPRTSPASATPSLRRTRSSKSASSSSSPRCPWRWPARCGGATSRPRRQPGGRGDHRRLPGGVRALGRGPSPPRPARPDARVTARAQGGHRGQRRTCADERRHLSPGHAALKERAAPARRPVGSRCRRGRRRRPRAGRPGR